jgi:hypothetical protein
VTTPPAALRATCTVKGKRRTAVACVVRRGTPRLAAKTKLRLTRGGRTYARGTVRALRASRRVTRGTYRLLVTEGRTTSAVTVRIR